MEVGREEVLGAGEGDAGGAEGFVGGGAGGGGSWSPLQGKLGIEEGERWLWEVEVEGEGEEMGGGLIWLAIGSMIFGIRSWDIFLAAPAVVVGGGTRFRFCINCPQFCSVVSPFHYQIGLYTTNVRVVAYGS